MMTVCKKVDKSLRCSLCLIHPCSRLHQILALAQARGPMIHRRAQMTMTLQPWEGLHPPPVLEDQLRGVAAPLEEGLLPVNTAQKDGAALRDTLLA